MIFMDIITNELFINAAVLIVGRYLVPFIPIPFIQGAKKGAVELVKFIDKLDNVDNEDAIKQVLNMGMKEGAKLLTKYLGDKNA